ncbi:amylo-alpha-1,6-glucosidase [Desulfovibrio desulfuricans]|uniref:amylo-alpha-1,6-glucosidase n=1 Tax=Desulfovibrio desulfuricans TaxID=876 RepID=UPI0035AFF8E0
MRFNFDKAACQNTRRALHREWLLANGQGDCSCSSILCCNTRKYHGLLAVNTQYGRHILLSTLEESVCGGGREFFFSTRQHPGTLYPNGHEYLEAFHLDQWPQSVYRVGEVSLGREVLLSRTTGRVLLRYELRGPKGLPALTLRLRPLLAYRSVHALTRANAALRQDTSAMPGGFGIRPYESLPPLYVQASTCGVPAQDAGDAAAITLAGRKTRQGDPAVSFTPAPDWCRNVEYFEERERGFDYSEDLFMPGVLEIALPPLPQGGYVYVAAGTEPCAEDLCRLWETESRARIAEHHKGGGLMGQLAQAGGQFCITSPSGRPAVLAGYPWFGAWGRDTLISLPGLTFHAGRAEFGLSVLAEMGRHIRNGLIPNMFSESGEHAYNSVDASLWYAFALQQMLATVSDGLTWAHSHAWEALKAIIKGYSRGPGMGIFVDAEGLLHAGDAHTQLTWMDAQAGGSPVTPRHGCPVEVNALWYNTLAFADSLAAAFREPPLTGERQRAALRDAFLRRFWTHDDGGHLGDVWRDGQLDTSVRPNQIFAVSLPHAVLADECHAQVVECVRNRLLTPYGLRTLAPDAPAYVGRYGGNAQSRDAAYHQGTVWPWLLGHYADALLQTAWDMNGAVQGLLELVTPLFCKHLCEAGMGSISEVFDGSPPYAPGGCTAQAWSVGECLRMLKKLQKAAPEIYSQWERQVAHCLAYPASGDKTGVCRAIMTLGPATADSEERVF